MSQPRNHLPDPQELIEADGIRVVVEGADAEYKLPPFDLRSCIVALQRFIFSNGADRAEHRWWFAGTIPPGGDPSTIGRWIEVRDPNGPSSYFFTDGVIGRHATSLPPGVNADDVIVRQKPSPLVPALFPYYARLIGLLDPERDKEWIAVCRRRLEGIEAMYLPSYRERLESAYLAALSRLIEANEPEPLLVLIAKVLSDYVNCLISGPVAGDVLLMLIILDQAVQEYRYVGVDALLREDVASFVQRTGYADNFLVTLLEQGALGPQDVIDRVMRACEKLQSMIEMEQDTVAAHAQSAGRFYGSLYKSIAPGFGAQKGLTFITKVQSAVTPPEQAVAELNVCDERTTTALCAMSEQFGNAIDLRDIILLRERVAFTRSRHGTRAAEEIVDQAIEIEMRYPAFQRDFLLGMSSFLPLRV